MVIQILGSVFLIFVLSRVYLRIRDRSLKLPEMFLWIIVFGVLLLFIIKPELTTKIADMVGVRRGTDLVVYASIALLFYLIFRINVMMENIEHRQVLIVRGIALLQYMDTTPENQNNQDKQSEISENK